MKLVKQFSQLEYDTQAARLPITIILLLTVIVILALQWPKGMSGTQGTLIIVTAFCFTVMIWFAVAIFKKIKSFYFLIQGLFLVTTVVTTPTLSILILITFGSLLIVQAFYFYHRLRDFLSYLVVYLLFGTVVLYSTYDMDKISLYLLVFVLSLILVFLVLTIFNQKELENIELAEANERIELLTRQNERQRMARDLHDSLIQKLIALNLKMDVIEAHVKKGHVEKAEVIIEMAKQQIGASITEARQVVDDLRLNMDNLTFKERLYEEIHQLQYIYNLPVDVTIQVETEISQHFADNIIALIKEAITNVYKHANATKVRVQLIEKNKLLLLNIHDNGVGMDVHEALKTDKSYGLLGMQERIALFDGRFTIESEKGTMLNIQFPIERSWDK